MRLNLCQTLNLITPQLSHQILRFSPKCKSDYLRCFRIVFLDRGLIGTLPSGTEEENREHVFGWKEEIDNLPLLWYEGILQSLS